MTRRMVPPREVATAVAATNMAWLNLANSNGKSIASHADTEICRCDYRFARHCQADLAYTSA